MFSRNQDADAPKKKQNSMTQKESFDEHEVF